MPSCTAKSLSGVKRTWTGAVQMSAFHPKWAFATILTYRWRAPQVGPLSNSITRRNGRIIKTRHVLGASSMEADDDSLHISYHRRSCCCVRRSTAGESAGSLVRGDQPGHGKRVLGLSI